MREKNGTRPQDPTSLPVSNEPTNEAGMPPCFGFGKTWRSRIYEWCEADPAYPTLVTDHMAIIPQGTPVNESSFDAYWRCRQDIVDAVQANTDAHIDPPWVFGLMLENGRPVGYGFFDANEDVNDLAWISCEFFERGLQMTFFPPEKLKLVLRDLRAVTMRRSSTS
jgi:hypothetical protein